MQQANENQARRDRSCFESLTLWDLKSHNHNPSLWVVKDREEDVEYQERSESEEGDEEEDVPMCFLLNHHFSHLATKFPECKFLMILAGQCVPNYPVSHLPTLFIYDSGCIINSLIGEKACGGRNVLEDELKWMLAQSGAFVIDSYEALYQEGTPITTPRSEQEQEDYSDDQSDHYDNQDAEV
ncbi:phosducin-like protein 2 isoform X2 [Oncorhynchus mykiss]|uniref:phosducin-like protein 2 isoform X2 n=1 Tax=Oncorhynchus mykiss TaxID=8022 RepID=UPI0018784014|nr:phosducin-like protein 2 isoform X2 [Oncorhynchus mykiss]